MGLTPTRTGSIKGCKSYTLSPARCRSTSNSSPDRTSIAPPIACGAKPNTGGIWIVSGWNGTQPVIKPLVTGLIVGN